MGGAATSASLQSPSGVACDASGNLFIADNEHNRIRKAGLNGIITTVAGNGNGTFSGDGGAATNASLVRPSGVGFDASGNLYIADKFNNRIRMVVTNGIITTVAGNGSATFAGDGGAATNAGLFEPAGVAMDASGNLWIADTVNNRIRAVYLAGLPTLTRPNVSVTTAGDYSVVISSPYGSVTSAEVSLTVTISTNPPQVVATDASFGFLTNQFGFNLVGASGQTIVVDGSTNLADWTPLWTNTANGTPFYFFDPTWTNFPRRFYRARLP